MVAIGFSLGREDAAVSRWARSGDERFAVKVVAQEELGHGLEHGNVDRLALARALAVKKGRCDGAHGINPRGSIAEVHREVTRHIARHPCERVAVAAQALDEIVVGGMRRIGPAAAEAEHARIDHPRVDLADVIVAQSQALHGLGTDVVGHDIRRLAEPKHRLAAPGLLQVEQEAALVAVELQKDRAHALRARRAREAQGIAPRGSLDLDDVCAEVSQDLRCIGPHHDRREVHDTDPFQELCVFALSAIPLLLFAPCADQARTA